MKKVLLVVVAFLGLGAYGNAQVIFLQDFESTAGALPAGWLQTVATGIPNDSVGWNTGTADSLASTGFAVAAHGRFAAVNDDKNQYANNTNSFLKTPSFSLSGVATPYLSFDCWYLAGTFGGTAETATVEVSTNGGASWSVLDTLAANAKNAWETRYISLAPYAGLLNVIIGFRYGDGGGWEYGIAIDNVTVFSPPASDIALISTSAMAGTCLNYGPAGGAATVSGTVFNAGIVPITSFSVSYVFNGGPVVTDSITGVNVLPFTAAPFTYPQPVALPAATGAYPLRMWASLVGDSDNANDTAGLDTLNAVAFMPHKRVVFEEATGTWCGYCVAGIVFMDSLWRQQPDNVSIISVHDQGDNYDPMALDNATTKKYDAFVAAHVQGYPSMLIDRRYQTDPQAAFADFASGSSLFGFADMELQVADTGNVLDAEVRLVPATDMAGDYRLELVVTEDRVGDTAAGYAQQDYYSYQDLNLPMHGMGYNFQDSQLVIRAGHIRFPFVARWTEPNDLTTSANGIAGSLPPTMAAGHLYSYNFAAINIAPHWVKAKLRVVALLIDNNAASPTFGTILNSVNTSHSPQLGISTPPVGIGGLQIFPSPTSGPAHIRFALGQASSVSVSVVNAMGQVVYASPAAPLAAGSQQLELPTQSLATGVYNVVLSTADGRLFGRLSVLR